MPEILTHLFVLYPHEKDHLSEGNWDLQSTGTCLPQTDASNTELCLNL